MDTRLINVRFGMDDFALKVLGKADTLELPLMGKELNQNVPGWGMQRGNNSADVLSPITGVIVEVNSRARELPEIARQSPYSDGWLFMVHTPDIQATVGQLMTDTKTLDWMKSEVKLLEDMIEDVAGPLAADGGYLQEDVFGNLPDLGWPRLTRTFLKT